MKRELTALVSNLLRGEGARTWTLLRVISVARNMRALGDWNSVVDLFAHVVRDAVPYGMLAIYAAFTAYTDVQNNERLLPTSPTSRPNMSGGTIRHS